MLLIGQNSFGINRFIGANVNGFVVIVDGPKRRHLEYRLVDVSSVVHKMAAAICSSAFVSHVVKCRNSVNYCSDWATTGTAKESWFDSRQGDKIFFFFLDS